MSPEIPKPVRKALTQIVLKGHEKALSMEQSKLAEDVDRWKRGEIDAFDLEGLIHKFHDGPAREIFKRFTYTPRTLQLIAAYAVNEGLFDESAVPAEAMPYIERGLQFLRL